jgi:hypothetical protein
MGSLYEAGWRQGSIVEIELPLDVVVLGSSGQPERLAGAHSLWAVATQDCDLDRADVADPDPGIEMRPLFTRDPPEDWGIRSARLLLTDSEYAIANSPRVMVSPEVLGAILEAGALRKDVEFARRQAFTTWLGLRYDRPAVPNHIVPLAKRISAEVARKEHREIGARVRDVLMQFDDDGPDNQQRYSLFAVLHDSSDEDDVRAWLARIALAIPTEVGVADRIEAASAEAISFSTVESSFAADVSQVTWRRDQPDPEGAT